MTRLIWQFELTDQLWEPQGNWQKDTHKWEIRYFWPIDQIIQLNLTESQLNWDKGACKIHHDIYWWSKDNPLNIKQRKHKIVYKALIDHKNARFAYDKKVCLSTDDIAQHDYLAIDVDKMAIQFIIHEKPKCVLELSKVQIQNRMYSSLCLESRCGELLDNLHHHLHLPGKASSYVQLLNDLSKF